ncbi:MAG: RlpA-like double-psi beta-barrel domain-containing protein [Janthinobacterium lividum]
MRAAGLLLVAPLLLAGCGPRKTAQAPAPYYTVGTAYEAGGVWRYPAEDFQLDATGIAAVLPDRKGLTADGEAYDGAAMAAAHPTLQLPAIARVTNLETGLQALVRVNDRGPANPARLIGLTRAAAGRLGMSPDSPARVRVQVESGPSQALQNALQGGAKGVAAAPRGVVTSETLEPLSGVARSSRGRSAATVVPATAPALDADVVPDRLPDTVVQVDLTPGQLWIRAGEFGLRRYADQVSGRLGGLARVESARTGRGQVFRVRAGPYRDVAAADMALDRAVHAGLTDAHIVVE